MRLIWFLLASSFCIIFLLRWVFVHLHPSDTLSQLSSTCARAAVHKTKPVFFYALVAISLKKEVVSCK